MERLTIPDVRVDEHTTRRSVIDVAAVREHAMKIYWRLKAYEDAGLTPEEIKAPFTEDTMINLAAQALGVEADRLRELAEADKDMTAAQLYFYQWQAAFNQLTQAISHIKDEDKAGKLCAAIRAQLAAWGKTMEDTQ